MGDRAARGCTLARVSPLRFVSLFVCTSLAACFNAPSVVAPADGGALDATANDLVTDLPPVALDAGSSDRPAGDLGDAGACRGVVCNGQCCRARELCRYDRCVEDLGRCTPTDAATPPDGGAPACPSDSYCDPMGYCTPYGVPADRDRDPSCTTRAIPAPLVPATQCAWTGGDINGTPVVAILPPQTSASTPPVASVIAAVRSLPGSVYTTAGVLHIFRGDRCEVVQRFDDPSQVVSSAGTAAVGDLDLDGRPEIVAASGLGGVIAFRYDPATSRWQTAWHSTERPGPFTGSALALADLGGDAHPEVVLGGIVFNWRGELLDSALGALPYQGYLSPSALADVDLDGVTELVTNNAVYQLDAMNRLAREPYDMAAPAAGFMAVADFGEFTGRRGDAPGRPELVHYADGRLRVRTVGGDTVFEADASAIQGGGPPAVADLDGDGQPEVVVAGRAMMAFDPDCAASAMRVGGRCASMRTDGVLWTQTGLQDGSSAINGVTVFDFDGDGRVEVVEADECFVRIFDGVTGRPRWSATRFSCTFIEMPVVVDTDGDLSAEIVVPANAACGSTSVCGLSTGAPDPILPGFACIDDGACPTGTTCRGGLCRCTEAGQCGEGNTCTDPLTDDGMGRVCRSTFNPSVGLKVYGDARSRWVPSRPIWNQYAYAITHVNDDGTVPPASTARNNWQVRWLNNFRQNTQGALGDNQAPDLTIGPLPGGCLPTANGMTTLRARFCNRGTGVAGTNSAIQFEAVERDGMRRALCTAPVPEPLAPGRCVDVTCSSASSISLETSVRAVADANGQVQECHEDNNLREVYRPGDCIP